MKKFLSLIVLFFILITNFGLKTYAETSDINVKSKTFFELQLNKTTSGKKFIKLIDTFIEKYGNDYDKLNGISQKIKDIDISKIKNDYTLNKIMYINAVINIELENLKPEIMEDNSNYEKLYITIYDDKRCTNCYTDEIINQLRELPSIKDVEIVRKDFSEQGVSDYLTENNVDALPLFVFSTNNFDISNDSPSQEIISYLQDLPTGEYYLNVGANFDPFVSRSERGFLMLDKSILDNIKNSSYIKGNKEAKYTWLEFSDLECPFCAKLHNADTEKILKEKYGEDLNIIFNHFPLAFHENAKPAAEIIECAGEQKGTDIFYKLVDLAYSQGDSSQEFLIDEAVKLGVDKTSLESCLSENKYEEKINGQTELGLNRFGVSGTPASILINNETLEYEIITGAYPTDTFVQTMESLKK